MYSNIYIKIIPSNKNRHKNAISGFSFQIWLNISQIHFIDIVSTILDYQ